jgi:ribosomal protein S6--L-glutamate ligase
MILSFHPIIEAHENIICAGREPNDSDLEAIQRADAVILPQGCTEALYRMARRNCAHVFPNLDVRFDYPGKCGQIELFRRLGMDHPSSEVFDSVAALRSSGTQRCFPSVLKLDWGGQGETVYKVRTPQDLEAALERVQSFESTGQYGFLIQEFIPSRPRSLRVVVIGAQRISYWRLQPDDIPFGTSVAAGAAIDHDTDPGLQQAAIAATHRLCRQTGLQLAGIDFIFNDRDGRRGPAGPFILEINYFFGRTGLGGSDGYYEMLSREVDQWLGSLSLSPIACQ